MSVLLISLGGFADLLKHRWVPDDLLKTVFLPLGLIFIMFGMGLGLVPGDFKRVFLSPKAKLLGLFLQLLALPGIAFSLALLFRLPGDLATGLMLVSACPGGATSNIISHLSRGDTALSVTLTAFSSVITVFTIPLVVGISMARFMAAFHCPGRTSCPSPQTSDRMSSAPSRHHAGNP